MILIAKHFGTFPFNHGRAGGIVVTDRHGPHADHGEDLLILQASHVGYDADLHHPACTAASAPATASRARTAARWSSCCPGTRSTTTTRAAASDVERVGSEWFVAIDNALLADERNEGLFLNLDQFVDGAAQGAIKPVRALSTARVFRAAPGTAASFRDLSERDHAADRRPAVRRDVLLPPQDPRGRRGRHPAAAQPAAGDVQHPHLPLADAGRRPGQHPARVRPRPPQHGAVAALPRAQLPVP
ncbi:MAG: hypothetical protein MZU95_10365, partial [Desulfomicrobium escambiense]|nr:hypothetical protein [Desulfomicrobium escambiense]